MPKEPNVVAVAAIRGWAADGAAGGEEPPHAVMANAATTAQIELEIQIERPGVGFVDRRSMTDGKDIIVGSWQTTAELRELLFITFLYS